MKYIIGVFFLYIQIGAANSQVVDYDKEWSKKYINQEYNSINISDLADIFNFTPVLLGKESRGKVLNQQEFKYLILKASKPMLDQLNISSWYLCSAKHEEYFQIWNMYYTKITKPKWDQFCKGLMILMLIDGVADAK